MVVRLPRSSEYADQPEKEHYWLPKLAPSLPLRVPAPLALGKPSSAYPLHWSIHSWLDGETATLERISDLDGFAIALARFLVALERIDAAGGPAPGPHNFHRGGALRFYDLQTRQALDRLKDEIDSNAAMEIWDRALESAWDRPPVWLHGDVSSGNLLVLDGRLSSVIDFGMLGVGDPACDLAIAWTLLRGESREAFRQELSPDADTWIRGCAWALWKSSIVAAGLVETNALEPGDCRSIISEVLASDV